jgi:hypothetical protein
MAGAVGGWEAREGFALDWLTAEDRGQVGGLVR